MTTSMFVIAGVALATIAVVLLVIFRSLLWPVIKILSWALAAIVTVAAIAAVMYYYVWGHIVSAMPDWLSTRLGLHKPDFGGWISGLGIWTVVLVLATLAAIALYLFSQITGRTLTGVLLSIAAVVLAAFAPWGNLLPSGTPGLPGTPAWTTALVPWLPIIGLVLLALIAFYLFGWVGGRTLAGALALVLAVALLPFVSWDSQLQRLTAWSAEGTCDGKIRTAIELSDKPKLINGEVDCHMDWDIIGTGVVTIMGRKKGEEKTFTSPGEFSFKAAYWKCAEGLKTCFVNAVFCPRGKWWSDEHKVCGVWTRRVEQDRKIETAPPYAAHRHRKMPQLNKGSGASRAFFYLKFFS